MQNHASHGNYVNKSFLDPKRDKFDKQYESMCKTSTQIHEKSSEIQGEAPTTSSHMPRRGGRRVVVVVGWGACGESGGCFHDGFL